MPIQFLEQKFTYREQGSVRFTAAQRKAYRLTVDVEIFSEAGQSYLNYKTLPPHGFYGYATRFYGSSVVEKIQLEFPRQRILDVINTEVFLYQQIHTYYQDVVNRLGILEGGSSGGGEIPLLTPVEAFDIRDTVIKFLMPRSIQFDVIINWVPMPDMDEDYADVPTDDSDPSDGKDEYPEPANRPIGSPYSGNPATSPFGDGSDPRDFGLDGIQLTRVNYRGIGYDQNQQETPTTHVIEFPGYAKGPFTITIGCAGSVRIGSGATAFFGATITSADGRSSGCVERGIAFKSLSVSGVSYFKALLSG